MIALHLYFLTNEFVLIISYQMFRVRHHSTAASYAMHRCQRFGVFKRLLIQVNHLDGISMIYGAKGAYRLRWCPNVTIRFSDDIRKASSSCIECRSIAQTKSAGVDKVNEKMLTT